MQPQFVQYAAVESCDSANLKGGRDITAVWKSSSLLKPVLNYIKADWFRQQRQFLQVRLPAFRMHTGITSFIGGGGLFLAHPKASCVGITALQSMAKNEFE